MRYQVTKTLLFICTFCVLAGFTQAPEVAEKEVTADIISHIQVKADPSNSNLTLVRFALHYDARVSVFVKKEGSSALIQLRKTAQLAKGVKTLKVDTIRYPASQYQLVIKAGKTSKTVDYNL